MRNIFVNPTERQTTLGYIFELEKYHIVTDGSNMDDIGNNLIHYRNIYITIDEEPKKGDWFYNTEMGMAIKAVAEKYPNERNKIIASNDKDLRKDDIYDVPHDFLIWFVKNPNCEFVELGGNRNRANGKYYYKIIIPNDDLGYTTKMGVKVDNKMVRSVMIPKEYFGVKGIDEDTLEKALSKHLKGVKYPTWIDCAEFGAMWQKIQDKKKFDNKEVLDIIVSYELERRGKSNFVLCQIIKWFEQFKKK